MNKHLQILSAGIVYFSIVFCVYLLLSVLFLGLAYALYTSPWLAAPIIFLGISYYCGWKALRV